jgi:conjugal transfer pilus assembly protein TraE
MLPSRHNADTQGRFLIGKTLLGVLLLSMVLNLVMASMFLLRTNTHRTTIVPPTVNRAFWVEEEAVDPAYLEQMAVYLLQLVLNATPATADLNVTALLRYIGPEAYGKIETSLRNQAAELKAGSISMAFYPRQVTTAEGLANTIAVGGVISSWAADRRLPDRPVNYLIKFRYAGGKLSLSDLKEVKDATGAIADEQRAQ